MKIYEYPIVEHSYSRYLRRRLTRLLMIPLRAIHSVLRLPILILASVLRSRYEYRKNQPPGGVARWVMRVASRYTPTVLICMPFQREECDTAYRNVVKPIIEHYLVAPCVRFRHPVAGDWRAELRCALLYHTIVVFDLSFYNPNVMLERDYYESIRHSINNAEQRHIEICFVQQPANGRFLDGKTIPGPVIYYNDDLCGLMDFAERFRGQMEASLRDIGYRPGFLHPWVLYPVAPWEVPDDMIWLDGSTIRGLTEDWVKDGELPDDIGKISS